MGCIRAFLAIYPDAEAHEAIAVFRDELRNGLPLEGYRWAKDGRLHLTLRFMGELPEERLPELERRVARACVGAPVFRAAASFEGAPWKGARVVALRVAAPRDALAKLQADIESEVRACGEPADPKAFNPHVTLARLGNAGLQPRRPHALVAEWEATEVVLVQSVVGAGGAAHSVLARFPLQ